MSSEVQTAIEELLKYGVVNRHSYFQLKYFVVGKEPTTQSKMWRCVKELGARKESLDAIDAEILETQDNIELEGIELERLNMRRNAIGTLQADGQTLVTNQYGITTEEDQALALLNIKELDIAIRKRQRRKQSLELALSNISKKKKETEEEAVFFLKAFESLQKVEPLKPFDDLHEQTKYWNEKLTQLANLKVLLHLPLETELVQTIMSLSDDCAIKNEMVGALEKERLLIEQQRTAKKDV